VTGVAALTAGCFTEVAKTLLWEGLFPDDDFEGMALGPLLDDGAALALLAARFPRSEP
jgi:hypothetical protein